MQLSAENTAIVVDSTADCPDARARSENWRMVPLYVRFGDETFRDYADITPDQFYGRLKDAPEPPKTSQPTPADFAAAYEELAGYEHILAVMLSAKLSGTYESARLAAESAGDARVTVIDSGVTSGGTVILADAIQRRLEAGTTIEEIDALVERFKRTRGLLFTVETLEYLVRGGRIGKAAGLAGQLLSVKPILAFDDGEVAPLKRVRGRAKALAEFEKLFVEGNRGLAGPPCRRRARRLAGRRPGSPRPPEGGPPQRLLRPVRDARPRHRHPRRPGHARPLLVPGRPVLTGHGRGARPGSDPGHGRSGHEGRPGSVESDGGL